MPTAKPPAPTLPAAIRADAAGIRREIARARVALELADNAAAALEGGHANEPLVAVQTVAGQMQFCADTTTRATGLGREMLRAVRVAVEG